MSSESEELIPGLPEDLAVECLSRCHHTTHGVSAKVSRRWRKLFQSREFHSLRKVTGRTRKVACLVQLLPASTTKCKPTTPPTYGISVFDPVAESWNRLEPLPAFPNGIPLFCQVATTEGKLVLMGGWDPATYDPLRTVFVHDFATGSWRRAADMPHARSFFAAAGAAGGVVFVAGGHDENKNALASAWLYDVAGDRWAELPAMSRERDECEGLLVGSDFWVVGGYPTEAQGGFGSSAERYDVGAGVWRRVEGAWGARRCPRSKVGVGESGGLFSWADADPGVRVGACGIQLGEGRGFVSGSGSQGGSQEFFMVEGPSRKLRRIDVPTEFLGFVQSGCCVEV